MDAMYQASKLEFKQGVLSKATIQNARYLDELDFQPDHPNEDEHFVKAGEDFIAFGVFDGHGSNGRGQNVAKFASDKLYNYFGSSSWRSVVRSPKRIPEALTEFFRSVESEFFDSIKHIIAETEDLKASIPPVSPHRLADQDVMCVFHRP